MIDRRLVVEFSAAGNDCPVVEATNDHDVVDERPPAHCDDGRTLLNFYAGGETGEYNVDLDDGADIDYLQVAESTGVAQCRCLLHGGCVLRELTTTGFISMRYVSPTVSSDPGVRRRPGHTQGGHPDGTGTRKRHSRMGRGGDRWRTGQEQTRHDY